MLHLCCSFTVTLYSCSSMGSLPQDAVLPELSLQGLPTGSSSSRTAPTWLHTMGSICQEQTAPAQVPHGQQLPPDPLLLQGLSTGRSRLQATSTCSTGGPSTGCSVEICSMWDPWAAGGQPAPPGASPSTGRRGTAAVSLEHLLPPAALTLGAAERFLTPP